MPDGRRVAVKIQYPEIADALEADLGTAQGLTAIATPLAKAMMPGLDPRMLVGEVRELVLEELDYELEAQHQRTFARAYRGHPFIYVPDVVTSLSRRRVMVSEWVDGMRFPDMQKLPQDERDRIGEIIMRFYFHSMDYVGRFNTDSHPGNFLLREDGSVAFIDFGNVKVSSPEWLQNGNRAIRAVIDGDKEGFIDAVVDLGYVHRREHLDADWLLEQVKLAGDWFLSDREVRIEPEYVGRIIAQVMDPRFISHGIRVARDLKVPAEEVWYRRVEIGVFAVLGQLRASGNWHRIARETIYGDPPATPLGEAAEAYFERRGMKLAHRRFCDGHGRDTWPDPAHPTLPDHLKARVFDERSRIPAGVCQVAGIRSEQALRERQDCGVMHRDRDVAAGFQDAMELPQRGGLSKNWNASVVTTASTSPSPSGSCSAEPWIQRTAPERSRALASIPGDGSQP